MDHRKVQFWTGPDLESSGFFILNAKLNLSYALLTSLVDWLKGNDETTREKAQESRRSANAVTSP